LILDLTQRAPRKKRGGLAPDAAGAVAEHNNYYIFAGTRPACDQAFACSVGITGFHSVAVGEPSQKFVRVFKFARAAIRITENKLRKIVDGTDGRVSIRCAGDDLV